MGQEEGETKITTEVEEVPLLVIDQREAGQRTAIVEEKKGHLERERLLLHMTVKTRVVGEEEGDRQLLGGTVCPRTVHLVAEEVHPFSPTHLPNLSFHRLTPFSTTSSSSPHPNSSCSRKHEATPTIHHHCYHQGNHHQTERLKVVTTLATVR